MLANMKKTVFFEKSLTQFLEILSIDGFVSGLLLGQTSEETDFVIHMTRTQKDLKHIDDLKEKNVLDHIHNVMQLLPGGITILGLFFVGGDESFSNSAAINKVRIIFNSINQFEEKSEFYFFNTISTSKLFLHYLDSDNLICKRFVPSKSGKQFEIAECMFESKKWHKINCYYDFEQLLPLYVETISNSVLNDKFMDILKHVNQTMNESILLLNGRVRKDAELLTNVKKQSNKRIQNTEDEDDIPIIVDIYSPYEQTIAGNICKISEFMAELKCFGTLCSEVYLHENATAKEAVQAVKEDIIRSLYSRLTMHCNSLLEDLSSSSPDESKIIHEPPKRISVKLPHSTVRFTDYLFPGEDASSLLPVKEQLDLDLDLAEDVTIFEALEAETDASEFYAKDNETTVAKNCSIPKKGLNYAILAGFLFSLLVLIFAIFFQRLRSY